MPRSFYRGVIVIRVITGIYSAWYYYNSSQNEFPTDQQPLGSIIIAMIMAVIVALAVAGIQVVATWLGGSPTA